MNWFYLAILAPFLWAISNFIDKFLVSKYFKSSSGALIIFSSLIGLPVAILIAIFNPAVLTLKLGLGVLIIFSSFLGILYLFPYFKALNKADASVVVPIFQSIPVFTFFLAYFVLGEMLNGMQIFGSVLIILGAVGISLKFDKGIRLTWGVLFLQLFASFLISLNILFFKFFALDAGFWTVTFWENLGAFIFGLGLLVFTKSYRTDFILYLKRNKEKIIWLNVINEIINLIAVIVFTYAVLLAPLALVQVINGFQPLFVFLIGIGMTLLFPQLIKENLERRVIIQKILFILLMLIGAYLLNGAF